MPRYVRSIDTHCFKSFPTISETFIEMMILYAHGALMHPGMERQMRQK